MKQIILNGERVKTVTMSEGIWKYGHSVFTTFLAFHRKAVFLNDHLNRLLKHAKALGISAPPNGTILSEVNSLLSLSSSLRIRVTLGTNFRCVEANAYKPPEIKIYQNGVDAVLTPFKVQRNFCHLKTGNYLPYFLAQQYAIKKKVYEGLLTDENNYLVDGSKTSPLLYCDNTLTILEGGLDGITREKVAIRAKSLGANIKRAKLSMSKLTGQLLLAGSGVGLISVKKAKDSLVEKLIYDFSPHSYLS